MTIKISGYDAITALRAVVAATGADTARGCTYTADGEPWCIAAVALDHHGVDIEVLVALDGGRDIVASERSRVILAHHDVLVTETALLVLYAAQRVQDQYNPWSVALEAAEARIALFTEDEARATL
jgi:hypothetical protein